MTLDESVSASNLASAAPEEPEMPARETLLSALPGAYKKEM